MFEPLGPFEVPLEYGIANRYIPKGCPNFWNRHPSVADRKGCYILAIRASKGYRPIYVGKATKSFRQECFESHKIAQHYTPALANTKAGTPVLFFIAVPKSAVVSHEKRITELEKFLIGQAALKNPDLSNIRNRKLPTWGVKGIVRSTPGKPSMSSKKLRQLIAL